MNPTAKPVTVVLDGHDVTLHFNFNTYSAFHKRTGKLWMDWWAGVLRRSQRAVMSFGLTEKLRDETLTAEEVERLLTEHQLTGMEAMTVVAEEDMQAIIWAAAHELVGPEKEVRYLFKYGEVGAMLNYDNYAELLVPVMKGIRDNLPQPKPIEEDTDERPTKRTATTKATRTIPKPRPISGGAISGPSDDEILASAIQR